MKFQLKAAVILALFAGFAFAASNAFAQAMGKSKEGVTMKITGGADASFGTFSTEAVDADGKVVSSGTYGGAIQANIILSGKDSAIDYYVRLRARGESKSTAFARKEAGTLGDGNLQTIRVRLRWTPVPIFNVSLGRLPGFGGTGLADRQPGRAYVGIGGRNAVAFFDKPTIHFQVTPGPVKVGLVIANGAEKVGKADADANGQTSTGIYAQAKFGGIKLGYRSVSYVGEGKGKKVKAVKAVDGIDTVVFAAAVSAGAVMSATGFVLGPMVGARVNMDGTANTNGAFVVTAVATGTSMSSPVNAMIQTPAVNEVPAVPGKDGVLAVAAAFPDTKYKEEASATVIEAAYAGGPLYVALEMTNGDEVLQTASGKKDFKKGTAAAYSALGLAVEVSFGQGKAYLIHGSETKGELKKAKTEVVGLAIGYKHSLGSKAAFGVEKADVETTVTDKDGKAGKPTTDSAIRFFIASGF